MDSGSGPGLAANMSSELGAGLMPPDIACHGRKTLATLKIPRKHHLNPVHPVAIASERNDMAKYDAIVCNCHKSHKSHRVVQASYKHPASILQSLYPHRPCHRHFDLDSSDFSQAFSLLYLHAAQSITIGESSSIACDLPLKIRQTLNDLLTLETELTGTSEHIRTYDVLWLCCGCYF